MKKRIAALAIPVLALVLALIPVLSPRHGVLRAQGTAGHAVSLTWTASDSAVACVSPCTFGYVVYRGTIAGGENLQLNATPVTVTNYVDSTILLTSSPQTFFYYVEAVETSGGVTVASSPSNEVSANFPGIPSPPKTVTDTWK